MGVVLGVLASTELAEVASGIIGIGIEAGTGSAEIGAGISGITSEILAGSGTIGEAATGISEAVSGLVSGGEAIAETEAITTELAAVGIDNTAILQGLDVEAAEILTEREIGYLIEEADGLAEQLEQLGFKDRIVKSIRGLTSKVTLKAVKSVVAKAIRGAITIEVGNAVISALIREITGTKTGDLENIVVIDENGNLIVDPNQIIDDPYKFGAKVADVTSVMIQSVSNDLKKDPSKATNENFLESLIKKSFNGLRNVGDRVLGKSILNTIQSSEFFKSPEQQKRFDQIWKVYNGKGIQVWKYQGKLYYKDETGFIGSYDGAINLKSTITAQGYIWLGPNSFNNALPVNLLDTIAMIHDTDYDNGGYFNPEADMRFISRCLQNLSRMGGSERLLAVNSSIWFATAGHVLSTYVHPHVVTFEAIRDKFSDDDLYNTIIPERKGLGAEQGKTPSEIIRKQGQREFYQGVEDTMDKNFAIFINASGSSPNKPISFEAERLTSLILNLRVIEVF